MSTDDSIKETVCSSLILALFTLLNQFKYFHTICHFDEKKICKQKTELKKFFLHFSCWSVVGD